MLSQMGLVLKSVEQTNNTEYDKDIAISLIADIVDRGCRGCIERNICSNKTG